MIYKALSVLFFAAAYVSAKGCKLHTPKGGKWVTESGVSLVFTPTSADNCKGTVVVEGIKWGGGWHALQNTPFDQLDDNGPHTYEATAHSSYDGYYVYAFRDDPTAKKETIVSGNAAWTTDVLTVSGSIQTASGGNIGPGRPCWDMSGTYETSTGETVQLETGSDCQTVNKNTGEVFKYIAYDRGTGWYMERDATPRESQRIRITDLDQIVWENYPKLDETWTRVSGPSASGLSQSQKLERLAPGVPLSCFSTAADGSLECTHNGKTYKLRQSCE